MNVLVAYVVRHGATALNNDNCYRGMRNVELAPDGVKDARALGKFLDGTDLCPYVISSDMKRASQTLAIINEEREKFGKPALVERPTSALRPLDVGDLAGQPRTKENQEIVEYHTEHSSIPFPGGHSLDDFRRRVRPVIREAVRIACRVGKPILILGHSSIVHEVGEMFEGHHRAVVVRPGGVAAIYWNTGTWEFDAVAAFKPDLSREQRGDVIS